MSRISCDVTKDLLASYLDKICSEESRELVEEHLQECPSCREFLNQLQEQDLGKSVPKLNYLKKVRYYMNARSVLGIVILLVVISIGKFTGRYYGLGENIYFYMTMPILMLTYAFVMEGDRERIIPVKEEWFAPVFSLMIAGAAVFVPYRAMKLVEELSSAPLESGIWELSHLGPYFFRLALFVIVASIVLLVVLFVLNKRRKCVFLFSQNLTWLSMYLALSFEDFLHSMSEPRTVTEALIRNTGILVGEFAVVTVLLFVVYWISGRKKSRGSV